MCSTVRVNNELDTARPEFVFSRAKKVVPRMVDATFFKQEVIGAGSFGLVYRVATKDAARRQYALKVEITDAESNHREAAVGMLMTALYAAGQSAENALLPVIKFYDSGTGTWTRTEIELFFGDLSFALRDELMGYAFTDDDVTEAVVNLSLMELSRGTSLDVFVRNQQRLFAPKNQDQGHKAILDIIVQLLLTLSDLQNAFEFVHYDVHSGNIKIETDTTKKYVWHYTVSSDTVFNVRSDSRPILLDFGLSRLRYKDKLYFNPGEFYDLEAGELGEYFPWADVVRLGCAVLRRMGAGLYDALVPSSALLVVLAKMFSTKVEDSSDTEDYRLIQTALWSKRHPQSPKAQVIDYEKVADAADGFDKVMVIQPRPGTTGVSAYSVLNKCRTALVEYISYAPTADETVVDMTLHIGRQSLATRAAWKAVEKSGARAWFEADDDHGGSPVAKKQTTDASAERQQVDKPPPATHSILQAGAEESLGQTPMAS